MKLNYVFTTVLFVILSLTWSCKETEAEKLEERIEEKADNLEEQSDILEERSDDLDDAIDDLNGGFDNMERAIENFKEALEEIESPEDRKIIRERINRIIDSLEVTINE